MKRLILILAILFTVSSPHFAVALERDGCSAASAGDTYCTCDDGSTSIDGSGEDATACNNSCYTLGTSSWLLEECRADGEIESIDSDDVATPAATSATSSTPPKADPLIPNLNVDIPGLDPQTDFAVTSSGGSVKSNFVGVYIEAVFSWLIGAAALIAVTMMMIGGLQYALARGKAAYIDKAKHRISNAITGLVLLLAAYNIAFVINPDLVVFHPLEPKYVDAIAYVAESGDEAGSISIGTPPTDIVCDSSSSIYEITASMVGKVTYRLGGKGGNPPYNSETKSDNKGVPYSNYCPDGQLCLDCSGFVGYVAACKGLSSAGESGGTAGIFSGSAAEKVVTCNAQAINGVDLNPGDLIGWATTSTGYGHVFMYIGDGYIMDSRGGIGREPGRAVSKKSTTFACDNYLSTDHGLYVRRRSQ